MAVETEPCIADDCGTRGAVTHIKSPVLEIHLHCNHFVGNAATASLNFDIHFGGGTKRQPGDESE